MGFSIIFFITSGIGYLSIYFPAEISKKEDI